MTKIERHAETLVLGETKYMLYKNKRQEVSDLLPQLISAWSEVNDFKRYIMRNTKGVAPMANHNILRKLLRELAVNDFEKAPDVLSHLLLGPPIAETQDQWYDEQYNFMIHMIEKLDQSYAKHQEYIQRVQAEIAKGYIEVDYLKCLIQQYNISPTQAMISLQVQR
jgi:hypothetical protein